MEKEFIDVVCVHDRSGNVQPLFILWGDGVKYKIEKILQRCPAASLKCGGSGIRYTCQFSQGQRRYLYLSDNRWFIEK